MDLSYVEQASGYVFDARPRKIDAMNGSSLDARLATDLDGAMLTSAHSLCWLPCLHRPPADDVSSHAQHSSMQRTRAHQSREDRRVAR